MKFLALLSLAATSLFASPYISVSSPGIYSPGQKPEIKLRTEDVPAVHMRLYRVEEPLEFFADQRNMRSPRVGKPEKPANFFHMLQGLGDRGRRNTRYLAREVLTQESRTSLRDYLGLPRLEKEAGESQMLGPGSIPRLEGFPLIREWTVKFEEDEAQDDYYYYRRYHYEDLELDITRVGVYLLEAYYGTRVAYTPVVVSEMSVVTKQDPGQVYVYAVRTADGTPVRRARVMVLSDTNRVARGFTDSKGLYRTNFDTTRLRVLAQDGESFALADNTYYYGKSEEDGQVKVYLHTERPIYRPEQTVYFKGIARRMRRGAYRNPRQEEVEVVVTDPEGNEIYRRTLETDSWGAFTDSLLVPSSSRLGRYTLSATADSVYNSTQFRVEEYRKPEFKVEVQTDSAAYVQGDTVHIEVAADYFFGAPVAGSEVKLKVYRRRHHRYYWYGESYVDELEAETTSEGKASFTYVTPRQGESYRYTFEAQVRDESRRSESGEASALVAASAVLVDLKPASYVVEPGEEIEIDVRTRDILGKPTPGRVDVVIFRNYWDKEDKVLARKTLSVSSQGLAVFKFKPDEAGSYYAQATAVDLEGNQSSDKTWFYASTYGGYYSWGADRLQVIFNKETYQVGDWAEALIITPYQDAHVLTSLEAENIHQVEVTELMGNTAMLRFRVRDEYVPNVYLSVCGVYQGDYFSQKEKLEVDRSGKMLTVVVRPDRESYEPGDRARFEILVKDPDGRPVRADVSLAVVDEAIYSLASEIAPSIQDYFYAERYDEVATFTSLYYSFYGYDRPYQGLSSAASDSVVLAAYKGREEPKVRKEFKDVAYWNGLVRTDRSGRGEVVFTWPDNLTTWRATARAITADTRVGETRQKSLVTKELLVRIVPPRFVTERDSLVIPTIVHNYTSRPQEVKVTFSADGLVLMDTRARTATIMPGASYRTDWPVRCEVPGDAVLTAKAVGSTASDALELTIPANPYGIERIFAVSAFMPDPDQTYSKSFDIPPEAKLESIAADLTLTPTVGSALFAGLSYLAGYPYGCVEQTMSMFFPDLVVADLIKDPDRGDAKLAAQLPKMIAKGLARLYGYQHSDGGWGWWEHDETMNIMTAYVVHGLVYARELGYEVNPVVIKRGSQALANLLTHREEIKTTERAYMVYALSMAPGEHSQLIQKQLGMLEKEGTDPYSKALMALTYHRMGDSQKARRVLTELTKAGIADGETVYFSGRVRSVEHWSDDAVETTATALRAFLAISPDDEIIPRIVFWLLRERRGNKWKSTKDSALALLALAEFLGKTTDETPSMQITMLLNGRKISAFDVTERDLLEFNRPIRVPLEGIRVGSNNLEVEKKGQGNLFVSILFSYYSKEEGIAAAGNKLKVQREFYRLRPVIQKDRLVYEKEPLSGPVEVGEPVLVKLYLDAEDAEEYVMVTDPLPAGFEVAGTRERYRIHNERYWWGYYDYQDYGYMYSGRELHDDHTAFFISYLGGRKVMSYVMEPYLPGTYRVLPAEASLMYFPDKRGHSSDAVITVVER